MSVLPNKQLGDRQDLSVRTTNNLLAPVAPTAAPNYAVYSNAGTKVASGKLPAKDAFRTTGWFEWPLFLGSAYAAGNYTVLYSWIENSRHHHEIDTFEIMAGGDADGPIQGMTFLRRPEVNHVVYQTESAILKDGHNPR